MAKLSVQAKERTEETAATLGDVLYAKCEAPVPEQEWVLVQAIAAGDQFALHALYERSHRVVFTLIMRITANRETAEERRAQALPRRLQLRCTRRGRRARLERDRLHLRPHHQHQRYPSLKRFGRMMRPHADHRYATLGAVRTCA